jgi:hypothetical protein
MSRRPATPPTDYATPALASRADDEADSPPSSDRPVTTTTVYGDETQLDPVVDETGVRATPALLAGTPRCRTPVPMHIEHDALEE